MSALLLILNTITVVSTVSRGLPEVSHLVVVRLVWECAQQESFQIMAPARRRYLVSTHELRNLLVFWVCSLQLFGALSNREIHLATQGLPHLLLQIRGLTDIDNAA